MVNINLVEKDVRCLIAALESYRQTWIAKQATVEQRKKMIDTLTCRGLSDVQDM